ncbi:MAG: ABC-F family ATP-binding cassette domain-containing protein [Streptosporangiaceae bacterium]
MGHVDVNGVSYALPDGRMLLDEVSFRVGEGAKVALLGANGAGKSTLLRIVGGDLRPDDGSVARSGPLGVMRQFVGHVRDDSTVRDLLISVAAPVLRAAAYALDAAELAAMDRDDDATQLRYAQALADYADAGGYAAEVIWDQCCDVALGLSYHRVSWREVCTLSGGEQKRLVLEALLRGPDEVLLLDEPDNYLDVFGKAWLEEALRETQKTVLYVSHDRELLARTADRVVTLELGAAGSTAWVHGGGFASYHDARRARFERLEELRRRWDEEHEKLRKLMLMYKQKAASNSDMASRYQAAKTRLRKFEEAGPPEPLPREQNLRMRLRGARTGKRVAMCESLELTGLTKPFDYEAWYGDRVAVLGGNGSGKTHFLRLLAGGGSEPTREHRPVSDVAVVPVEHTGRARLGARVRPGWFAQTHEHPELEGRRLLQILARGDGYRQGMPREEASRALARYELAYAAEQTFETLSGGQQARFQILLLELSGATLLLLDEPTDNLDLVSAEALQDGLEWYQGAVIAVTHDRWFARSFDRYLIFGADGRVYESPDPIWERRG